MTGKKGVFGPAVIGEEAFAKEQEEVAKGIDYFGPAVVGDSEPQKPTAAQLREQPGLAALHGIKTEQAPASVPAPQLPAPAPSSPPADNPQLSVRKLEEALEAGSSVDPLIELEFQRPEGPRKDALRLFVKFEKRNLRHEVEGDVYARPEVLERLEAGIKGKPATVPA